MAEYKSRFTGQEIDAGVVRANDAVKPNDKISKLQNDVGYLTEHQPLKTINDQSIIGYGNIVIEGGSGTSDYENLSNKPSINDVELNGNKSLGDLGIQSTLVNGINIKSINNISLLGEGNIDIQGGGGSINFTIYEFNEADLSQEILNYIKQNKPDLLKITTAEEGLIQDYHKGQDGEYYCIITGTLVVLRIKDEGGTLSPDVSYYELDDITKVSGISDGTNWTTLTIGNETHDLASGDSSFKVKVIDATDPSQWEDYHPTQAVLEDIMTNDYDVLNLINSVDTPNIQAWFAEEEDHDDHGEITRIKKFYFFTSRGDGDYDDIILQIFRVFKTDEDPAEMDTLDKLIATKDDISGKQDTLVSGTNIKTINNQSILGEGNINIEGSGSGSISIPTQCLYGVPNYFEGKKILVTGDSITDTVGNYANGHPWWKNLQDWLGLAAVYNDGKSSTGIKRGAPGLFARIDNWATTYGTDFDAIIIMENMNDVYKDVALSSFSLGKWGDNTIDTQYGAVKLVIEKLQALYPMTPILWVTSGPRKHYGRLAINPINPGHGRDSEFEPMVTAIKEVCAHYGVPVCDMYHNSLLRPWLSVNNSAWYQSGDGVHPNQVGHQIMAQTILQSFVANIPSVAGTHGLYAKRDITYNLTDVEVVNNMAYITNGSEFFCWLKPTEEGGTVDSVTVTMGGNNITSSVWKPATNTIEIGSVTGNVVITASSASSVTRYSITNNLTNVTNTNTNVAVAEGTTYNATINPAEGYTVGTVTITMGGTDITSTAYNSTTHTITIGNVSGNIVITGTGDIRILTVTNNLIGVTNSNNATTVQFGDSYSGILTKDNPSAVLEAITVLMDETDYTNSNYDPSTGEVAFPVVTGNITITATAGAGYSISYNVTGATLSNNQIGITENAQYTSTVTADLGRTLSTVTVTMGGTDITSTAYNSGTGVINITSVTGNVTITVTTTAQTFTITNNLTGVTNSNSDTSKTYGEAYIGTLTANTNGYQVVVDSITMNGNDVTYSVYNESTNTINIAAVNGNIIITAHEEDGPSELVLTASDFTKGTISNDGTLTPSADPTLDNIYTTDIIHLSNSRPGNVTVGPNTGGKETIVKIAYYNSNDQWVSNTVWYNYGLGDPSKSVDIPAGSNIRIALASNERYGPTNIETTLSGATITLYNREPKTLVSLSKSGTLNKTQYVEGQSLDITGLTFTATYSDTTTKVLTASELTFNPDPLTEGTTSVTVSYTYGSNTETQTVSGITVEASTGVLSASDFHRGTINNSGVVSDNADGGLANIYQVNIKQFDNVLITPLVDNVIWKVVYYDAQGSYLSNSGWMCRVANQYATTVANYQITPGAYARVCIANDVLCNKEAYTIEELFNRVSITEQVTPPIVTETLSQYTDTIVSQPSDIPVSAFVKDKGFSGVSGGSTLNSLQVINSTGRAVSQNPTTFTGYAVDLTGKSRIVITDTTKVPFLAGMVYASSNKLASHSNTEQNKWYGSSKWWDTSVDGTTITLNGTEKYWMPYIKLVAMPTTAPTDQEITDWLSGITIE